MNYHIDIKEQKPTTRPLSDAQKQNKPTNVNLIPFTSNYLKTTRKTHNLKGCSNWSRNES